MAAFNDGFEEELNRKQEETDQDMSSHITITQNGAPSCAFFGRRLSCADSKR